jgi:hypothetical protein
VGNRVVDVEAFARAPDAAPHQFFEFPDQASADPSRPKNWAKMAQKRARKLGQKNSECLSGRTGDPEIDTMPSM